MGDRWLRAGVAVGIRCRRGAGGFKLWAAPRDAVDVENGSRLWPAGEVSMLHVARKPAARRDLSSIHWHL